mgnify:FL=1
MALTLWLSLATICLFGAMSPGPSLAVVVRNTLVGGRRQGVATAISHGVGVAMWALLTATGIGLLVTKQPELYRFLQWLGAGFLAYLGVRYLLAKSNVSASLAIETREQGNGLTGVREGFLIAVMNPTLPLFFLALFSQFVRETAPWQETVIITATAGGIDIAWYILVALVLSHTAVLDRLRRRAHIFDRVFGVILLALAIYMLI